MHDAHVEQYSSTGGTQKSSSVRGTYFCKDYQTGKCAQSGDHYGLIRNERKWLQHICGLCWTKQKVVARHPESSQECTNKAVQAALKPE